MKQKVYICDFPNEKRTIHFVRPTDATHEGLLVDVKEIECEHLPDVSDETGVNDVIAECRFCGATMSLKWVADE